MLDSDRYFPYAQVRGAVGQGSRLNGSGIPARAALLDATGCKPLLMERKFNNLDGKLTSVCKLRWKGPKNDEPPPNIIRDAMRLPNFISVEVQMEASR